ncbi:PQQ-like beta-propeller repeat protein [Parabacteroides sp. FAFU027]|uniref:PQQ-like beta-propeller repeat protein n=1 Tax=Parabacteroides sp. FAFU027 TaxID=2922715 RepID=UPI001FAEC978|nr:PQQ-like beta-propeller repeat protein [Parabacteroides sp. FAFU027]
MKKLLIGLLLIATTPMLRAQEEQPDFQSEEIVAGRNLITGESIKGTKYIFQKNISDYDIDSTANLMTIKISKGWISSVGYDSKFMVYDTRKKTIIWTKKYNSMNDDIVPNNGTIIYWKKNKAHKLDLETGEEKLELKYRLYLSDFKNNVGLGYPSQALSWLLPVNPTPDLKGINLNTGEKIWERNLPRYYGWYNIRFDSDSTLFIVSEGLHYINILNGKGWDITDPSTATYNAHNINSPVFIDSLQYYWASRDKLWCFNKKGEIQWSSPLNPDLTSSSFIYKKDSAILLINCGVVRGMYNYSIPYGKPYIAKISTNGNQENFILLSKKKEPLEGFIFDKDTLLVCFPKKLIKYNLKDFSVIREKEFKFKSDEKFEMFIGSRVYKQKADQSFVSLTVSDSTNLYLLNKGDNIVAYDYDFNQVSSQKRSDFFILVYQDKNYRIIKNNDKSIVIDKEGKSIAEINLGKIVQIFNNALYQVDKNILSVVDLNAILNDKKTEKK